MIQTLCIHCYIFFKFSNDEELRRNYKKPTQYGCCCRRSIRLCCPFLFFPVSSLLFFFQQTSQKDLITIIIIIQMRGYSTALSIIMSSVSCSSCFLFFPLLLCVFLLPIIISLFSLSLSRIFPVRLCVFFSFVIGATLERKRERKDITKYFQYYAVRFFFFFCQMKS